MSRKVDIRISGRKIEGYPTVNLTISFDTIEEFIKKADNAIEETRFGKVDCYVDNFDDVLNSDEVSILESEYFIVE
jgi:gamma-glutamylcysteine synthetase